MSFLFDVVALFVLGAALYYVGEKYKLERLTKITIGVLVVLAFFLVSVPLYLNIFRFPAVDITLFHKDIIPTLSGREFTVYWPIYPFIADNLTALEKQYPVNYFPLLFAVIIFILYPISIYAGFASALVFSKNQNKKIPTEYKSYEDVKSRSRISKDPKYCIARYPDNRHGTHNLKDAVKKAVDDLGGMSKFVKRGDKVLIKANICGGNPDISATFTSLELVGYVIDMVRAEGGEPFICDADMLWAKFREVARDEGWYKFAQEKNVELVNLSETDLVYFDFGDTEIFKENEKPNHEIVSRELIDSNVIISIPKMKTHLLTGVTLGMKNMYGTLPMEDKSYYHSRGINPLIYWINYAFSPTLTIIDGSEGGEAEGPLAATSVLFNTIVASDNVALADAVASKLMGFEQPFEDIEFLKYAKNMIGEDRSLLGSIPRDLRLTAAQLISKADLPKSPKDGKWVLRDQEDINDIEHLFENLLAFPGIATLSHIGADFILLDASRLPYWKVLETAILQMLYTPRFWIKKSNGATVSKNRSLLNLAIFSVIALISLFFFFYNGYYQTSFALTQSEPTLSSAIWIFLGIILALGLGLFFSGWMKTKHLVAAVLSSMLAAFFVESFAPQAGWWVYPHENLAWHLPSFPDTPLYPLFAIPIFTISVIGLSYLLRPFLFAMKGRHFSLVPYAAIIISIFIFLYLGGYMLDDVSSISKVYNPTIDMILIYSALAILGLYYNSRHDLDWNLAVAIVSIAAGFSMEYFGAIAWFWAYPHTFSNFASNGFDITSYAFGQLYNNFLKYTTISLPIFIGFTWALNTWAALGLAQIFGIDLSEAFVKDDPLDAKNPMALKHNGDFMMDQADFKKALNKYEMAIQILEREANEDELGRSDDQLVNTNCQLADVWHDKGNALASMHDFKKSSIAYDEAIRFYDSYPESASSQLANTLHHKAVAVQNLNGPRKALEVYDKALDAYKKAAQASLPVIDAHVDSWIDKALALEGLGEFEDAIEAYNGAIQTIKSPESNRDSDLNGKLLRAKVLDFRGFSQIYNADIQGNRDDLYKRSIKDFNEAIGLVPQSAERTWLICAYWGLGYAKSRLGDYKEALEDLNKSISAMDGKNVAFILSDKGSLLLDYGMYYEKLARYEADQEDARKNYLKAAEDSYKDALDAYERAIDLCPDLSDISKISQAWMGTDDVYSKIEASAWKGKGDAHRLLAKPLREAFDLISKCDDLLDNPSGGSEKVDAGKAKEAWHTYQKAIKLNVRLPFSANIPEIKIQMGREDDLKLFRSTISDAKKKLFEKLDEEEDYALNAYRRALDVLDILLKDSDAMSGKGCILYSMARYKEALRSYEDAIRIAANRDADDVKNVKVQMVPLFLAKAYTGKGSTLCKMGKQEEAEEAFGTAREKASKGNYYLPAEKCLENTKSQGTQAGGETSIRITEPSEDIRNEIKKIRFFQILQPRGAYLSLLRRME